ncbi:MAG: hypothetical protein EOO01_38000, partial [Chitinophagaceae bacterium]
LCIAFFSCKKDKNTPPSPKAISAFGLKASLNSGLTRDITGEIKDDTIRIGIPSTANKSALKPSITFTGKIISPGNEVMQDFTNPVAYVVTGEDGSTKKYIVVIRVLSSNKEILDLSFLAAENPGELKTDAIGVIGKDSIIVTVDGLNPTRLVPSIRHNGQQISALNPQGNLFVDPIVYTVTAEDGTTRNYTLIVHTTASLFVGGMDGFLYAFDPGNGNLRWKYKLSYGVKANPTYANGTVFIGNSHYLYALDGKTGQLKWRTAFQSSVALSIQLEGNLLYVAMDRTGYTPECYMMAIDPATGNTVWKSSFGSETLITSPTVSEGRVVVPSFYGGLYCFDALNGNRLWTFPTGVIRDNPSVKDGVLYIGSEYYRLLAIDMKTGLKKWAQPSYNDNNNNF